MKYIPLDPEGEVSEFESDKICPLCKTKDITFDNRDDSTYCNVCRWDDSKD